MKQDGGYFPCSERSGKIACVTSSRLWKQSSTSAALTLLQGYAKTIDPDAKTRLQTSGLQAMTIMAEISRLPAKMPCIDELLQQPRAYTLTSIVVASCAVTLSAAWCIIMRLKKVPQQIFNGCRRVKEHVLSEAGSFVSLKAVQAVLYASTITSLLRRLCNTL